MIPTEQKYYFETNALFYLDKVRDEVVPESFTSALTVLELIAGLRERPDRFAAVKSVLKRINSRNLAIEWILPQRLLFEMFDASKPHRLVDPRPETLKGLMSFILESNSINEFLEKDRQTFGKHGYEYLSVIENKWSGTLMGSSATVQQMFKQTFSTKKLETITLNGKTYNTSTKKEFEYVMKEEFPTTRLMTISAFTKDFLTGPMASVGLTKDQVVASYNGLVDYFIDAFALYMLDVMLGASPSKNDTVDFHHLTYLRNYDHRCIVSNDKIFDRYCRHKRVKVDELCMPKA